MSFPRNREINLSNPGPVYLPVPLCHHCRSVDAIDSRAGFMDQLH